MPRPADAKAKAQGQTAQATKKAAPTADKVAPGTTTTTAKPKQNPGTNETKPTV